MKNKFSVLLIASIISILVCENANAQYLSIGNDTTMCQLGAFNLTAVVDTAGVPCDPSLSVDLQIDDNWYGYPIDIGFPFTFYGNTYNQCVVGSNGDISFNLALATTPNYTYNTWPINAAFPSATPADLLNSISCPWEDLYPYAGGTLSYTYKGLAPNRRFIVSWDNVAMFSCTTTLFTGQIVLHETSNLIDIIITQKNACGWNGGAAIEGTQNSTASIADVVPGRNYPTNWTAANDEYRYTPNGTGPYQVASIPYNPNPVYPMIITWFENGSQIQLGGMSCPVNPSTTTTYSAILDWCVDDTATMTVNFDPMTLNISGSTNPSCANAMDGSITAAAAGTAPYNYVWTDPNGNVVQSDLGVSGTSALLNAGVGTYTVNATGALGCQLQQTQTLTAAPFAAEFTWTPTGYCQNKMVQFQDQSTGVIPIAWNWDFGDGSPISMDQNPSHIYIDSGMFTVKFINAVVGGCTDTVTHIVQVWPAPIASFTSAPASVCVGQGLTLIDKSSYYPVQWDWSFGDTSANGSGSVTHHAYAMPGTYSISLIVTDSLCGNDTIGGFIDVLSYPIANIGNDTSVCKGSVVKLDAGVSGVDYVWSTGATTQSITVSPNKPSEYNVTLNNHGCTFNDAIEIGILCEMYIPNAFSPNRDGTNDIFIPFGSEVTHVYMRVYNRWGQMVYAGSSSDKSYKGWNGYIGSDEAAVGVYSYVISATFINNETKEYTGNVTLLR
ncbi:hypothetical protein LBMAG27_11670 [Bacteroidota bacterium]|nr:hypothetical protein LBMAG27_11670 [Bacteroidota bacterium]